MNKNYLEKNKNSMGNIQYGNGNDVGYYPAVSRERIGGMVEYGVWETMPPIFIGELLTQQGGYNKIINPNTRRKVNINSKLGKKILYNYLKIFRGNIYE